MLEVYQTPLHYQPGHALRNPEPSLGWHLEEMEFLGTEENVSLRFYDRTTLVVLADSSHFSLTEKAEALHIWKLSYPVLLNG